MMWEWMMFAATGITVSVGCLVPNRWLPPLPNDKLMHMLAFGVLTLLALRLSADGTERALWLIGLLAAGWVIECLQQLVPERQFCWRDLAANALGIAIASAGAQIYSVLTQP